MKRVTSDAQLNDNFHRIYDLVGRLLIMDSAVQSSHSWQTSKPKINWKSGVLIITQIRSYLFWSCFQNKVFMNLLRNHLSRLSENSPSKDKFIDNNTHTICKQLVTYVHAGRKDSSCEFLSTHSFNFVGHLNVKESCIHEKVLCEWIEMKRIRKLANRS